ncbi:hypothetical protein ACOMHN_006158 [Nucella lapillus]
MAATGQGPNPVMPIMLGNVTHIVDPSEFWMRIGTEMDQESFRCLEQTLGAEAQRLPEGDVNEIVEHTVVLVSCPVSRPGSSSLKPWRRAEVSRVDREGNSFDVWYIDYGNTEIVPAERVRGNVLTEIQEYPPTVYRCALAGIKPVARSWTTRGIKTFQKLVSQGPLKVVSVIYDHDAMKLRVNLYPPGDSSLSAAHQMLEAMNGLPTDEQVQEYIKDVILHTYTEVYGTALEGCGPSGSGSMEEATVPTAEEETEDSSSQGWATCNESPTLFPHDPTTATDWPSQPANQNITGQATGEDCEDQFGMHGEERNVEMNCEAGGEGRGGGMQGEERDAQIDLEVEGGGQGEEAYSNAASSVVVPQFNLNSLQQQRMLGAAELQQKQEQMQQLMRRARLQKDMIQCHQELDQLRMTTAPGQELHWGKSDLMYVYGGRETGEATGKDAGYDWSDIADRTSHFSSSFHSPEDKGLKPQEDYIPENAPRLARKSPSKKAVAEAPASEGGREEEPSFYDASAVSLSAGTGLDAGSLEAAEHGDSLSTGVAAAAATSSSWQNLRNVIQDFILTCLEKWILFNKKGIQTGVLQQRVEELYLACVEILLPETFSMLQTHHSTQLAFLRDQMKQKVLENDVIYSIRSRLLNLLLRLPQPDSETVSVMKMFVPQESRQTDEPSHVCSQPVSRPGPSPGGSSKQRGVSTVEAGCQTEQGDPTLSTPRRASVGSMDSSMGHADFLVSGRTRRRRALMEHLNRHKEEGSGEGSVLQHGGAHASGSVSSISSSQPGSLSPHSHILSHHSSRAAETDQDDTRAGNEEERDQYQLPNKALVQEEECPENSQLPSSPVFQCAASGGDADPSAQDSDSLVHREGTGTLMASSKEIYDWQSSSDDSDSYEAPFDMKDQEDFDRDGAKNVEANTDNRDDEEDDWCSNTFAGHSSRTTNLESRPDKLDCGTSGYGKSLYVGALPAGLESPDEEWSDGPISFSLSRNQRHSSYSQAAGGSKGSAPKKFSEEFPLLPSRSMQHDDALTKNRPTLDSIAIDFVHSPKKNAQKDKKTEQSSPAQKEDSARVACGFGDREVYLSEEDDRRSVPSDWEALADSGGGEGTTRAAKVAGDDGFAGQGGQGDWLREQSAASARPRMDAAGDGCTSQSPSLYVATEGASAAEASELSAGDTGHSSSPANSGSEKSFPQASISPFPSSSGDSPSGGVPYQRGDLARMFDPHSSSSKRKGRKNKFQPFSYSMPPLVDKTSDSKWDPDEIVCINCGVQGHMPQACPKPMKSLLL